MQNFKVKLRSRLTWKTFSVILFLSIAIFSFASVPSKVFSCPVMVDVWTNEGGQGLNQYGGSFTVSEPLIIYTASCEYSASTLTVNMPNGNVYTTQIPTGPNPEQWNYVAGSSYPFYLVGTYNVVLNACVDPTQPSTCFEDTMRLDIVGQQFTTNTIVITQQTSNATFSSNFTVNYTRSATANYTWSPTANYTQTSTANYTWSSTANYTATSSSVTQVSENTTSVTFTVHVLDSDTSSPISGASVYLDGNFQGTTDSNGTVGVSTTYPPADHSYFVTADGYQTMNGTWTIGSNSGGYVTVQLTPNQQPPTSSQGCQVNTNISRQQAFSTIKGVIMDVSVQANCEDNPSILTPTISLINIRPAMYVVDVYTAPGGVWDYSTSVFMDANGLHSFSPDLTMCTACSNPGFFLKLDVEFAVGVYVTNYVFGNVLGFTPSDSTLWQITQEIKQEYMPNTPYLMTKPSDWINDFAKYMGQHPNEFVQIAAESGQSYSQGYFLSKVSVVFALVSTIADTIRMITTELNSPAEETITIVMTENTQPTPSSGSYISPTTLREGVRTSQMKEWLAYS